MSSEALRKFAHELKTKREGRGITLEEINFKTRIDIKFLEAIEDGNFEVLPEVYVRAFIKEYANSIDLEGEAIIKKYDLSRIGIIEVDEPKKDISDEELKKEFGAHMETSSKANEHVTKQYNSQLILGIGGLAVILIILIYFLLIKESDPEIIRERPYEEVVQEQEQRYRIDQQETTEIPVEVTDSLSLKIFASDTTWMQITIDDVAEQEFTLFPNGVKFLKSKSNFQLLIGNSGGVKFFLNDSPLEFIGSKGRIRNVMIDANGIQPVNNLSIPRNE